MSSTGLLVTLLEIAPLVLGRVMVWYSACQACHTDHGRLTHSLAEIRNGRIVFSAPAIGHGGGRGAQVEGVGGRCVHAEGVGDSSIDAEGVGGTVHTVIDACGAGRDLDGGSLKRGSQGHEGPQGLDQGSQSRRTAARCEWAIGVNIEVDVAGH